jgi:hypothetical protein
MEFFSNSTASRIVSNQMKSLRNKTDSYAEEICKGLQKKSKFSKKFYEEQSTKLFGESLLSKWWEGRTLSNIVFIPFSEDFAGNKIPIQVCVSVYLFSTRSHSSMHHELSIITNHALQRIMQRTGELNVIKAVKEEIDLECVSQLSEMYASFGDLKEKEFKINTKNGVFCIVKDEVENILKCVTWYPKK